MASGKNSVATIPALGGEASLNRYLSEIRKFPLLQPEEEYMLAKRFQEYILRSWSLVKMGTTAAQKKLFFNLRRMKSQIDAFEDGDLKPEHVTKIATDLGVSEEDVTSMNRRMAMGGDTSLNVMVGED